MESKKDNKWHWKIEIYILKTGHQITATKREIESIMNHKTKYQDNKLNHLGMIQ